MNKNAPGCIVIGIITGVNGKATYGWMGGAVTGHMQRLFSLVYIRSLKQPARGGRGGEVPSGNVVGEA